MDEEIMEAAHKKAEIMEAAHKKAEITAILNGCRT
jgi:hypothetical protein